MRLRTIALSIAVMAAFACGTLRVSKVDNPTDGGLGGDAGFGDDDDDDTLADGGKKKKPKTKDAASPADGTSVSTKGPVEIIASGFREPQEILLTDDSVVFTLHWDTALVRKVAKDGETENEVLVEHDAAAGENAIGRDLTLVGDDVIWMNGSSLGSINSVPLAGGPYRRIRFIDHGTRLTQYNGLLYFSEEAFSPFTYAVQRMQVDAGGLRLVDDYEIDVGGIAVDATGVYWTASGALANGKAAVRTQPLNAPDASFSRELFSGTDRYEMGGLALSANEVFWAEIENDRVMRVDKAGGSAKVVADVSSPRRVALDKDYVWFTTATTISRVPLAGGPVEDFVTEIDSPLGIAVDDTHVYWAAEGSGEIGRIHK